MKNRLKQQVQYFCELYIYSKDLRKIQFIKDYGVCNSWNFLMQCLTRSAKLWKYVRRFCYFHVSYWMETLLHCTPLCPIDLIVGERWCDIARRRLWWKNFHPISRPMMKSFAFRHSETIHCKIKICMDLARASCFNWLVDWTLDLKTSI